MKKITKNLREKINRIRWIASDIEYEIAPGVHTYSACDCGRSHTRCGICHLCHLDEIKKLVQEL